MITTDVSKGSTGISVELCRGDKGVRYFRKRFSERWDRHWPERENRILMHMQTRFSEGSGIAVPYGPVCDADGNFKSVVETHDAGPSVKTLLKQQARWSLSPHIPFAHPFQHCWHWWRLLDAALQILEPLHRARFIHVDIQEGNICVPKQTGRQGGFLLDFDKLRLIDATYSWAPEIPFDRVLPLGIEPTYQSPLLMEAVAADHASGRPDKTNRLDWRVDIYSLGSMMARLMPDLPSANSGWDGSLIKMAWDIISEMKAVASWGTEADLPHRQLIDRIRLVLSSQHAFADGEWRELAVTPGDNEAPSWRSRLGRWLQRDMPAPDSGFRPKPDHSFRLPFGKIGGILGNVVGMASVLAGMLVLALLIMQAWVN